MRHGFLLVSKPRGPSSADVVSTVRMILYEQNVGHLGTLDPQAQGLLVLAVGAKALKVVELFRNLPKEYIADVQLGALSTTDDAEGRIEVVEAKPGWEPPEESALQRVIQDRFLGEVSQVPPMASAISIGGERAYRKLRQGRGIAPPERQVEISACEILSYVYPALRLRIACSAGTYIRAIARDLGKVLRCGGYLAALMRTRVGDWHLEDAVSPSRAAWAKVIPLKEVLRIFPGVEVTEEDVKRIRCGTAIEREVKPDTIAWYEGLPIAILTPKNDGSRMAHPRKVL